MIKTKILNRISKGGVWKRWWCVQWTEVDRYRIWSKCRRILRPGPRLFPAHLSGLLMPFSLSWAAPLKWFLPFPILVAWDSKPAYRHQLWGKTTTTFFMQSSSVISPHGITRVMLPLVDLLVVAAHWHSATIHNCWEVSGYVTRLISLPTAPDTAWLWCTD